MSGRQRVTDRGNPRKYWTQVPNLLDDSDLDPYARTLYTHYLRIAGQRETCEETVRVSAMACHMSLGMVLKARQALVDGGWVEVEDAGTHGRGADQRIHLLDRWTENMARFGSPPAPEGGNVHVVNNSAGDAEKRPGGEQNVHDPYISPGNVHVVNVPFRRVNISNSSSLLDGEEEKTGDEKKREEARARAAPTHGANRETHERRRPSFDAECLDCSAPCFSVPPWSGRCGTCLRKPPRAGPAAAAAVGVAT